MIAADRPRTAPEPRPEPRPELGPRLDRAVTLHFQGDWGLANFHRALSWLCHVFCERAPGSRVAIWNGSGGRDNVAAVGEGEVQLAITTPAGFVAGATTGEGAFAGRAYPRLRALATLPQDDAMVLAVSGALQVSTPAELRAARPPLRIAVAPDDGVNLIGYAAHRLLEASGLDRVTVETWGGGYVETHVRPRDCLALVIRGEADAIVHEAMMIEPWREAARTRDLRFLSLEPDALRRLEGVRGWTRRIVAADQFPGQPEPLTTMDFSDFLVLVRDDLPEDVAHLLTWCLVETRGLLEQQYRHIEPRRSALTYPLVPAEMAKAPIPLHPGAARYYREAGPLGP